LFLRLSSMGLGATAAGRRDFSPHRFRRRINFAELAGPSIDGQASPRPRALALAG
jgi:hypothetical protein